MYATPNKPVLTIKHSETLESSAEYTSRDITEGKTAEAINHSTGSCKVFATPHGLDCGD